MRTYHHLTVGERYYITTEKQVHSLRSIAKRLNISPSTVSRELRRNVCRDGVYRHEHAHAQAQSRRRNCRNDHLVKGEMKEAIVSCLKKDWSPEQITGRFRLDGKPIVSHQTIYNWLWRDRRNGGEYYKLLRRKHRYQHNRKTAANHLPDRRMIDERPEEANSRSRIGDWEIDTMISGKGDNTVLITMVDRKSRYLIARLAPTRKAEVFQNEVCKLIRLKGEKVLTVTSDNGTEFAEHKKIARRMKIDFFFARAHHPWERGTNENTNGLLRQYIPTVTKLKFAEQIIKEGVKRINSRPRKVLGYQTAEEVFFQSI